LLAQEGLLLDLLCEPGFNNRSLLGFNWAQLAGCEAESSAPGGVVAERTALGALVPLLWLSHPGNVHVLGLGRGALSAALRMVVAEVVLL
jgi:hypothetical protein